MKYIELRIYATRQGIELITAMLISKGIDGIMVDDPDDMEDILNKKNEYGWDYIDDELKENMDREPVVSVYFDKSDDGRKQMSDVKKALRDMREQEKRGDFGQCTALGSLNIEEKLVDDDDWKYKWKDYFKPYRITDKITVKPTWEDYEAEEGELVIEIDPGMAFGTGTHETTSLCMKLMEKYIGDKGKEKKILDVGCGSGILSIGAALLGCEDVLGIEIDDDAVRVAEENVAANDASGSVRIMKGDLVDGIDFEADIIVANLMADLVVKLCKSAGHHLADGGVFISSGILVEKEKYVAEKIENAGFKILEIQEDGEWCAIAAGV